MSRPPPGTTLGRKASSVTRRADRRPEPASLPSEAGSFLVAIAKEAIMSRYAITLRTDAATDENAVVGYDPPLRTYFILGFEIRRPSSRFSGSARALSNIRPC